MNEIKRNLKLFTLLAALLAGNVTLPEMESEPTESRFTEEPTGDKAREQEQEQRESFYEKIKRKTSEAVKNAKDAAGRARDNLRRTFSKKPAEQSPEMKFDAPDKAVTKYQRDQALRELGLDPASNPSVEEISAAYKKAVLADHPDKGGTGKRTNSYVAARDILRKYAREEAERQAKNTEETAPDKDFVMVDKPEEQPEQQPSVTKEPGFFAKQFKALTDFVNQQIDMINKFVNQRGSLSTAKVMADAKAKGTFDAKNEKYFTDAMDKLSTKQKEEVANTWKNSRETIYRKEVARLQKNIDTIKESKTMTTDDKNEEIDKVRREIADKKTQLNTELEVFRKDIEASLKPNEVIVTLSDSSNPSFKSYEIINIRDSIDFTKPLDGQMKNLFDNQKLSTHSSYEGVKGRISSSMFMDTVSTWISKQLDINTKTSISDQLNEQIQTITGKPWAEIDPKLQEAILKKTTNTVQKKYDLEKSDEIIHDAGEMFKEAERKAAEDDAILKNLREMDAKNTKRTRNQIILSMSPNDIETLSVEFIKDLDPRTISKLSKDQVQALNLDQVETLSPAQKDALNVADLRLQQLDLILDSLSPKKISELTKEQLQALPKGKLSAALAKLSVADLQTIEAAFKSAGNPFETTITREIARQTSEAPVDSYKGDFDVHRIAINNAKTLNTRPENISSLSLDIVSDLDAETASKMSDDQVNAFTKEQLNALGEDALNVIAPRLKPTTIAELSPTAISTLTPTTFSKLSSDAIEDLTPQQAAVITKPQLDKLNNTKRDAAAKAIGKSSLTKAEELGLDLNEPLKGNPKSGKGK